MRALLLRTQVIADWEGATDAPPVITPTVSPTYDMPRLVEQPDGTYRDMDGHSLIFKAYAANGSEVTTATFDFTVWEKWVTDTGEVTFASIDPITGLVGGRKRSSGARGPFYVQVTALANAATATTFKIFACSEV